MTHPIPDTATVRLSNAIARSVASIRCAPSTHALEILAAEAQGIIIGAHAAGFLTDELGHEWTMEIIHASESRRDEMWKARNRLRPLANM